MTLRFADIAVNLSDPMFQGIYHGKQRHESDLSSIISRARERGVEKILITGTSLDDSRVALNLATEYDLHCTAGVHPTSTNEISSHPNGQKGYFEELEQFIEEDRGEGGSKRIIAIGEIGLDYDRLHFSSKEVQLDHLPSLLSLGEKFNLPFFLHSRTSDAHIDLIKALKEVGWWKGVVHSFTGTIEEMKEIVDFGLYIGINGCSLKTEENLQVVKQIPIDRLLLETDAPWCSPTSSHASSAHLPPPDSPLLLKRVSKPDKFQSGQAVKGRMEPADIGVIAHIVASVRGEDIRYLSEKVWQNTLRSFYPNELN